MAPRLASDARAQCVTTAAHSNAHPACTVPLKELTKFDLYSTYRVAVMTNETVAAAVESGDPVSWVVTDFPGLQARAPPAWRHCFCDETQNTSSCWSGVPTSLRQPSTRRAVCSPTPSLTVSWRGCLTQITAAEAERGAAYPLVLRMRPDLYFTRPFTPGWRPPPALEPAHPAISGRRGHQPSAPGGGAFAAFVSDFAALMTRDVASISLKQQPAAGVHETCWMPSPHREYCNACIVNASGLGRALRVWLPDAVLIRQCTNETAHSDGPTAELYPYCAGEADEVNPVIRDEDLQRLRAIWAKGNMTEDLSRPQGVTLEPWDHVCAAGAAPPARTVSFRVF